MRTVLSPRWLLALLVAVVFAVACVALGRWQWGRYEDKQLRADTVRTHYGAPAVPFGSVVGRLPLDEGGEWTRVTLTGSYDASQQLLVRNRVLDGSPGLEVLVPLTVDGGTGPGGRLLVDRGWVQNADTAAAAPTVPAAPVGRVTVQGWLRRPEPSLGRDLPRDQLASVAVADAEAKVGGTLLPAYLELESERTATGSTPPRPTPLGAPDTDLGPNQAYAFQWWLFSVFGFVFYGYRLRLARQELRDGRAQAEPLDPAEVTVPPAPTDLPATAGGPAGRRRQLVTSGTRPRPARAKKVRIWDEEDG